MFVSNAYLKSLILFFSFILSIYLYVEMDNRGLTETLVSLRLNQLYGIISVYYLLLVMFAGPLYRIFPDAPGKDIYRASLGGLGISAFYFAFLHSWIAFFGLGGFSAIPLLPESYLLGLLLGFGALLILALLAMTSFTWAMRVLGRRWKTLHRFVYLAGILAIVHIIMLGSSFRDFTAPLPLVTVLFVTILIILNLMSTRLYLLSRFPWLSGQVVTLSLSVLCIISYYLLYLLHVARTHIPTH